MYYNFTSISYDETRQILKVQFGKTFHEFLDVPMEIYNNFISAINRSRYFEENIKHSFVCLTL